MLEISNLNKSFKWSLINIGSFTCTFSNTAVGHSIVGSLIINTGTSGRFLTKVSDVNVAITYRIA